MIKSKKSREQMDRDNTARRRWWRENPTAKTRMNAWRRESRYRTKYGITLDDKTDRLREQGFVCGNPSCGRTTPGSSGWSTDHNHTTNQLRGELCHGCNASLGLLGEDEERIAGLIAYLRKWNSLADTKDTVTWPSSQRADLQSPPVLPISTAM